MPTLKKKPGESKSGQMVRTAMHEFKRGKLHSGSKTGPVVKGKKQAIAIGLSEAKKKAARNTAGGKGVSDVAMMARKKNKLQHRRKRNIGRS